MARCRYRHLVEWLALVLSALSFVAAAVSVWAAWKARKAAQRTSSAAELRAQIGDAVTDIESPREPVQAKAVQALRETLSYLQTQPEEYRKQDVRLLILRIEGALSGVAEYAQELETGESDPGRPEAP